MRKNNGNKARLNFYGGVLSYYEVKGLNLDRFIESLKRKGIELFDVKKSGNSKLLFAVKYKDTEKLFAITADVWYNTYKIRRIKFGGKNYPLFYIIKNIGLTVGIALFFAFCVVIDDFVFSFSFTGSGSVRQREIRRFLNDNGITEFSRFSGIDVKSLEDRVLAANPYLSFVSIYKSGNRLVINSALTGEEKGKLTGRETALISPTDGVIESVKVYRGTAVKSVGEEVLSGDVIVAGYADVKEERISVNVVATASVKYSEDYFLTLYSEDDGAAVAFAEAASGKTARDAEICKTEENGVYFYTVKLFFIRVVAVG